MVVLPLGQKLNNKKINFMYPRISKKPHYIIPDK